MHKNTLIAVLAVCLTVNFVAGGFIYTERQKMKHQEPVVLTKTIPGEYLSSTGSSRPATSATSPEPSHSTYYSTQPLAADGRNETPKARNHKIVRNPLKQEVINNLDKYLNLVPSYITKSPDGIGNIRFSVVNTSAFSFDEVTINFRCYLANGTLWNEGNVPVGPIPAGSTVNKSVPDQIRGSRIEWETISIKSTDLEYVWPY